MSRAGRRVPVSGADVTIGLFESRARLKGSVSESKERGIFVLGPSSRVVIASDYIIVPLENDALAGTERFDSGISPT